MKRLHLTQNFCLSKQANTPAAAKMIKTIDKGRRFLARYQRNGEISRKDLSTTLSNPTVKQRTNGAETVKAALCVAAVAKSSSSIVALHFILECDPLHEDERAGQQQQ
jgi:hypothetical protein